MYLNKNFKKEIHLEESSRISIGGNNSYVAVATHYYSKRAPTEEENYWHDINEEPTIWE